MVVTINTVTNSCWKDSVMKEGYSDLKFDLNF